MRSMRVSHKGVGPIIFLIGILAFSTAPSLTAAPFDGRRMYFADERFGQVWSRTDAELVRREGRTWYWGPGPWFDYAEFYRQGVNGLRTVQYFDKARMELNDPADRSGPNRGVTNGLLVKELVSGRVQLGDSPFDFDQRAPSDVPVAGNPRDANPNAPGYAAFAGVATLDNGYRDPPRLGERVAATIDRSGNLGLRPDLATPETEIVQYNTITGHNIPRVFWEFMHWIGPVLDGEAVRRAVVVDWLFAMGLPITDPYWTRARIGESEQDVLVQLFERRVLTYVPSNPPGYKVEMGNVGQHYFQWRYPHLGTPWAAPEPNPPLVYASNVDTGSHWELYRADFRGGGSRFTRNPAETVAYSWLRSWDPAQMRLLVDSRRGNLVNRQIYALDMPAVYEGDTAPNARVTRLSYSDGTLPPPGSPFFGHFGAPADAYNASVSPDGAKILFISTQDGANELYLMSRFGGSTVRLTFQGCTNETPSWSPDGRRIYWVSNCDGDFDLYRADLVYNNDYQYLADARLEQVTKLTDNAYDDRYARVAPNGRAIAYSINPNGNWDLALYDLSTGTVSVLLAGPDNTEAPTWAANGRGLAFAGDGDGDYEIYTLSLDTRTIQQITFNTAQDRWPLWAQ